MIHVAKYYKEELSEFNPVEKDGVITFQLNNQPVSIFPRTGYFNGLQVKNGVGLSELKKRIKQCQKNTSFMN